MARPGKRWAAGCEKLPRELWLTPEQRAVLAAFGRLPPGKAYLARELGKELGVGPAYVANNLRERLQGLARRGFLVRELWGCVSVWRLGPAVERLREAERERENRAKDTDVIRAQ